MVPQTPGSKSGFECRIRIKNHLDTCWLNWFEDLTADHLPDGHVMLSGFVPDQPALFGLLNRIRDLNLKLVCFIVKERKEERYQDYIDVMCRVLQRNSKNNTSEEITDENV